jgi:hypothetical protein
LVLEEVGAVVETAGKWEAKKWLWRCSDEEWVVSKVVCMVSEGRGRE